MENTFYKFGKFLTDNSEKLDAKFENDRENGQLSRTPNVFKFAELEFQRLNENKNPKKITLNELKNLVKQIVKEETELTGNMKKVFNAMFKDKVDRYHMSVNMYAKHLGLNLTKDEIKKIEDAYNSDKRTHDFTYRR
jgi:hypothetical protein